MIKEEEKLMKLDLQKENKKVEANQIKGIKLNFFKMIYVLLQNQTDNYFRDVVFIICQFIQLMSFPLEKVFSTGWKNYWYGTVGHFFRFFQLIYLWEGNTQFFIISYIITCLYIIIFIILTIYTLHLLSNYLLKSKLIIGILLTIYEFESIVNIPFLRILFSVFNCENGNMIMAPKIQCQKSTNLVMMIISCILILTYLILIILFHMTFFEFGAIHGKVRAAFTSSTEVLLVIMKFILVVCYQFITHQMALALITICIGIFLLFDFLSKQPFINNGITKLYYTLYLLFVWTGITCIVSLLLKNSKFEGGILLLILGYPFILLTIISKELEFTLERVFEYVGDRHKDGYKVLMEIEYFLKLEDSLEDKIKCREQKILYFYINNYENNCTDPDCSLKQFLNIPLKLENFNDMKICLLQHAEMLYKNAVSKYPFNAKLRLSYAIFLYKRLNKKQKGTNEILLLNKYITGLEDAFLIYRAQRYIEEENEGHSDKESNTKTVNSVTYKAILNNIKVLIGKITTNYIDFWTILAISDESKSENFQKMSRIGTRISKLNEDLISDFERLERVNLYDQDTIKLYSQYLSEILNNHAQANIYNNKLIELEQRKHQFNEENLFDLNYRAMSRSEEYKYIVISGAPTNFNTICNLSLSICTMFGFSKEELIGKPLDYILPELFCIQHKKVLSEKVEEFKKTMLVKNKTMSLKVRSEPKIIETFGKTKMKYLVPIKMKISLVASEEGNIYCVAKIITENHSLITYDEENIYILTNKELIVQNFTPNAPKLLYLQSSAINNNLEITDYIKEFSEEFLQEIDNLGSEIKENTTKIFKQIKIDILKKMFSSKDTKKLITWRLGDVINNNEQSAMNYKVPKFAKRDKKNSLRMSFVAEPKSQSAFSNQVSKNLKFGKAPKKNSLASENILKKVAFNSEYAIEKSDKGKDDSEKQIDLKDLDNSILGTGTGVLDSSADLSPSHVMKVNNSNKSIRNFIPKIYHKFFLSVSPVKFGEYKIGYIFKFELFTGKYDRENSFIKINNYKKINYAPSLKDHSEIEKSDVTFTPAAKQPENKQIMFNITNENPMGVNLGLDNTYIPILNQENRFTIDINKMSFKQFGQINSENFTNPEIILHKQAVEKVQKITKSLKKDEESEEEEEESSYTSDDSENENSSNISEIKKNKLGSLISKPEENLAAKIQNTSEKNSLIKDNVESSSGINLPASGKKILSSVHSGTNNNNINNNVNNNVNNKTSNNNVLTSMNSIKRHNKQHEEEDYYHVNINHITLFLYNYNTGFVEVIKDPKYKISQVVKSTIDEKEKLSKMNAKLITNPKLAKDTKKKSTTTKKTMDDEELDAYSEKKIKLKEIQKALASKEKQSSIINLCIFSFIIFFLIIGSSVTSILINSYLKNRTITYYNLIEKSVTLYRNLLFEINYVREMILLANPMYDNIYDNNRLQYFENFSSTCYEYYIETSFVLSNLSTTINTLSEENKAKVIGAKGELEIIDPLKSGGGNYVTKSYELLIYSAFHELNAALYHVSQMNYTEINSYEDNVYYFTRNAMNYMMVIAEQQIDNFTDEFYNEIKKGHRVLIICIIVMIIVYLINFFVFVNFYQKVEERKQSYLSVFYEIGSSFIVSSLAKCEKFSQKIQIQDDIGGQGEKISLDSSSNDTSDIENEIGSISSLSKIKDAKMSNAGKARNVKKVTHTKTKIGGFFVLFILLVVQIISYYYYYQRLSLYRHYVDYEYYNNKYNSRFLFPFIALREYLYDPKKILLMEEVDVYLDNSLTTFYTDLANISNYREKFTKYLPNNYKEYVDSLYRDEQCSFIENFLKEHPNAGFNSCEVFFYNTSNYGFQAVLTTYIEEIRIMRDLEVSYLQNAAKYGFQYNESLVNTGFDDLHYKQYKINSELYNLYMKYNPAYILREDTHKTSVIIYRFVVMKVVQSDLDSLFEAIHLAFDNTTKIGLLINIVFIIICTLGFFAMWLPFVMGENETIYKTKNMLSIIPKEVLITLPHINIMLGIDDDSA